MNDTESIVHGEVQIDVTAQTADLAPSINKQHLKRKVTIDNPNCHVQDVTVDEITEIEQVTQFRRDKDKLVTGTVTVFVRTTTDNTQQHMLLIDLIREAQSIVAGNRYDITGAEITEVKEATATETSESQTHVGSDLTPKPQ